MLRIFGFYSFGEYGENVAYKMKNIFEIKSKFTKFINFRQSNIFLDYEATDSGDTKNFYSIDAKEKLACFIVGNIHAYDNQRLLILTGTNLAKEIMRRYRKGGLGFVKFLRGAFNIVLIDKKKVFLINDCLGLSAMYLYKTQEGLLFSNTAEPIIWMNHNNVIDYISIARFIVYGFVPNGKTFIQGLDNQEPATIVEVNNKKIFVKKYVYFQPFYLKNVSYEERLKLTKEIFSESVRIRISRSSALSDLSGGWDTRFILANLLELNKKPIAFTARRNKEDFAIARKIIKKWKIEHITLNFSMVPPALREDHNFKFKPMKTIYDSFHNTNIFNKNYKELIAMKFFTSPRFTGLFGTELFGYIPEWFIESISLNFDVFSAKIFTPVFLSRLHAGKNRGLFCNYGNTPGLSNQIYSFLYQIGRTYLNAHYTRSWERPTKFFSYLSLNPFADSKFVALLCSFDYDRHMQYRLYQEIYKNYYPGFLDIAWTRASHRIQKNLKNDSQQEIDSGLAKQQELLKLITEDVDFRAFVKQNSIVQKTGVAISARLKELYFLFKWYDVYKSVLCPSDVKFLSD